MGIVFYELDPLVFQELQKGINSDDLKNTFEQWQGAASEIADYVATWGIERFWAMSRSPVLKGGDIPDANSGKENQRRYFAWGVARVVLCQICLELKIHQEMTTEDFQKRFQDLKFNQQVLLIDLLMEIADTIQFWTMRIKDATVSNRSV